MSSIIPEKIKIHYVKVFKSNHNVTDQYLDNPVNPASFKVGYSQDTSVGMDDKRLRVRLNIDLKGIDETENEVGIFAEYGIEFQVEVENLEEFFEVIDNEPKFSSILGGTIMGILYSTARGIIIERTQSTFFRGVILPVINPSLLIEGISKNSNL